ncbi:MAG: hypothetical protein ABIP94_06280, partial [Planctomycetota bacterium]
RGNRGDRAVTPADLHLRDEILQVLFWMRGEGLGDDATKEQLGVFLVHTDGLPAVLEWMAAESWIEPGPRPAAWQLTELGVREGGRRFGEAFADAGLGSQGHGACAPGCDCETLGPEHCEVHAHDHDHAHD